MHFYQHAAVKPHVTSCTDTPETNVHHQPSYSGVLEQREFSKHTKVDLTMGFFIGPLRQLSVCPNSSSFVWSYRELFHKSKTKRVWATWCTFGSIDCWCRVKIVFWQKETTFQGLFLISVALPHDCLHLFLLRCMKMTPIPELVYSQSQVRVLV